MDNATGLQTPKATQCLRKERSGKGESYMGETSAV